MTKYEAVVLHDFFVDRLLFSRDLNGLLRSIKKKNSQGGGGIHDVEQLEMRGGNAVNLAHALVRLGTTTFLITHSDESHEMLLRGGFSRPRAELSVKRLEPGLTVALEGRRGSRRVNIMLGHAGGAGRFHPSILSDQDWGALTDSKVVCTVNWSANRYGTELLREIRRRVGRKTIFIDPADVRDRIPRYRQLLAATRREHLIDWLSVNEFEARATARLLGLKSSRLDLVCRDVASALGIRLDLHTERASFTSEGREVYTHRVNRVVPRVLTGAGDVWDAASVHFYLRGFDDQKRIELADQAARLYLCSSSSSTPSEREVLSLLEHP